MKKTWIKIILFVLMISLVAFACSDKKEQPSEKGVMEEMTDNVAKKMADKLTAPVDRARDATKLSEDHMKDMEEAMPEK